MKRHPPHDTTSLSSEISARIRRIFPRVERIVLFGSRARRTDDADSDIDILVVTETDLAPSRRTAKLRLALAGLDVPFDVLVVTPLELESRRDWRSTVISRALAEGTTIHDSAGA
jgi:predicted nucleotidyltransferase